MSQLGLDMLEFEVLDELHEMFQVNTHGAQHIQDEVRLRLEQKTEWILTNQDNLRGLDGDGIDRIDVADAESGFGEGVKWSEYIDHLLLALRGYPADIYRAGLDDVKTYRQFALMERAGWRTTPKALSTPDHRGRQTYGIAGASQ